MPTVPLIIPTYATETNGRLGYVGYSLDSLGRQDLKPSTRVVPIVVDDDSPVDLKSLITEYKRRYPLIRYSKRTKRTEELYTSSNAINHGIDLLLTSPLEILTRQERDDLVAICYLHSDDLYTSDSVQSRLQVLGDSFVFADRADFNGATGIIKNIVRCEEISDLENMCTTRIFDFPHHTMMWRLTFLAKLREYSQRRYGHFGVYDPNLTQYEDTSVILASIELAKQLGLSMQQLRKVAVFYREHGQSITGLGTNVEKEEFRDAVIRKHNLSEKTDKPPIITKLRDVPKPLAMELEYLLGSQ